MRPNVQPGFIELGRMAAFTTRAIARGIQGSRAGAGQSGDSMVEEYRVGGDTYYQQLSGENTPGDSATMWEAGWGAVTPDGRRTQVEIVAAVIQPRADWGG